MAGVTQEQLEFLVKLNPQAVSDFRNMMRQFESFGGQAMYRLQQQTDQLRRKTAKLSGETKKGSVIWSKLNTRIVQSLGAYALAEKAIGAVTTAFNEFFVKGTLVAAQIEETGSVLEFLGQNAGYSRSEIRGFISELEANGIAQLEARQALLRATQAQIGYADAVKLGRIAQDAAVIGLTNSSEAYQQLIDAVAKGRIVMLRSLGIQGTFEDAYKKMARTLNKSQVDLTDAERLQARLNLVFEQGKVISGAYVTAMENVSKRMRSLPRHFQAAQQAVGQHFVPALGLGVDTAEGFLKTVTWVFSSQEKIIADRLTASGQDITEFTDILKDLRAELDEGTLSAKDFVKALEFRGTEQAVIRVLAEEYRTGVEKIDKALQDNEISVSEHRARLNRLQADIPKVYRDAVIAASRAIRQADGVSADEMLASFGLTDETFRLDALREKIKPLRAKYAKAVLSVADPSYMEQELRKQNARLNQQLGGALGVDPEILLQQQSDQLTLTTSQTAEQEHLEIAIRNRTEAERELFGAISRSIGAERARLEELGADKFREQWDPAFQAVTQTVHEFGAGIGDVIVNGKKFEDVLKDIGKQIVLTVINIGIELLLIRQLTNAYQQLAAAKGAAYATSALGPVGALGGIVGAVGGLLGIGGSPNSAIVPSLSPSVQTAAPASTSVNVSINVEGNATPDTIDQMRAWAVAELPQLIRDGYVKVPTTDPVSRR